MKKILFVLCFLIFLLMSCVKLDDFKINPELANASCKQIIEEYNKCIDLPRSVTFCKDKYGELLIAKCTNKRGE